ncbi:SEC-C metal-binding domain-containing protein [Halomonas huangheensis]|uniref:Zinc chelation protein SecC n=1 Tax=Halomonas huangheensis TaxID=1178482 RepID=W1N2N6_9GAMM|nr:SEC-C metal-binding domain-containing protein [Halomonas huangheensis]ALM52216.1 zinc chelation protein SecC [Halomonas huangheensis]ERL49436.1 zinc chelation protein SecC [Halomonas huangheensis]
MLAVWVDQLLGFASGALAAIRQDERYPTLMRWAREQGPGRVGGDKALAQALAPELWSQTPLERLGFACEMLARPGRNEPCWCDSGRKMKQCCGAVSLPGHLPPHLMWMLSLREWKGNTLKAALASGRAPAQALLEAGLIAAESGQRGRAQQILESLFDNADWDRLPEQAEPAFEILLDLFQERGFYRKREALLDEVLDRGPMFLRGVALERLCLMHLDNDDLDSARSAFVRAQQALPDSPTLAYIEAMLLLHEGHEEEAVERSRFWLRRLTRSGELDADQLQFLADLADNPGATLADQLLSAEEDLGEPLVGLQTLLAELTPPPPLHVEQKDGELVYHSSAREDTFYAAFHEGFQVEVDPDAAMGFLGDPWVNAGQWLPVLCSSPEQLDSPAVLQSLALALTSRFGSLPWMAPSLFEPLAERLERWLIQIRQAGEGPFSWDRGDNAQLLRAGLALVVGMERGSRQHSRELAELLLSLDNGDSLGLRELVLDQLLREGRNDEALEISREALASTAEDEPVALLGMYMGQVLALYRLGELDEAASALERARRHNGHAVMLLCADNPRPANVASNITGAEVEPGTRAEAWQYRTLMRDQWRSTPGALDWLNSVVSRS